MSEFFVYGMERGKLLSERPDIYYPHKDEQHLTSIYLIMIHKLNEDKWVKYWINSII